MVPSLNLSASRQSTAYMGTMKSMRMTCRCSLGIR